MCDCPEFRGKGWKGWPRLQDAPRSGGVAVSGAWVDLSHPLNERMPRVPFFPEPKFERLYSFPAQQLNVTRMEMVVHAGTHVDSPRHFFEDGPAFEEIPIERLCGEGLVWPIRLAPGQDIDVEHLADAEPRLRPGDMLILDTGSHRAVGTAAYDDHPSLTLSAARWIVRREIKLLAVDTPTPDTAVKRRSEGFDYPIHRLLLSHGVLIAEHLTNLGSLSGRRVEVIFSALNITGSDGAPARVLARAIDR